MPGGDRHLDWEGCFNVRDLGGLPADGGRRTRRGAVVRADAVDRLTEAGWSALHDHGVRTVVDLRNEDEREPDLAPRPADLTTLHLPLDGQDAEFWARWSSGPQFATPLYYRAHVERFPELSAHPGGVLVHCVGGRDRTGQVSMLLLALVGVAPEAIVADYALSAERLRARYAWLRTEDEGPVIEDFLARQGTSASEVILATVDVGTGLLSQAELTALRERLLAPHRSGASPGPAPGSSSGSRGSRTTSVGSTSSGSP